MAMLGILLPKESRPRFPEKCAVCCKPISIGGVAKVKVRMDLGRDYNSHFFLSIYLMRYLSELAGVFNSGTQDVPAHLWCRKMIGRRSRVKLYIITGMAVFFLLMAFTPTIHYNEVIVNGPLTFLGIIGAVAGVFFVDLFIKPDPVFIMETFGGIEYRFADIDMAGEFAVFNGVDPPEGYGETVLGRADDGTGQTDKDVTEHSGQEEGGDATRPRVRRTDNSRRAYKKDPRDFRN